MTMTVREMIAYLESFEDQDATVQVVVFDEGRGYDSGSAREVDFVPSEHAEYTDLRGNPWVAEDAPYRDRRFLVLGVSR